MPVTLRILCSVWRLLGHCVWFNAWMGSRYQI